MANLKEAEPAPMYDFYSKFYIATKNSLAFSKYCNQVFQKDLTQDGFSDILQLQRMIDITRMNATFDVLDIGCGNGKMAEYISDLTGAHLYGIDYIPEAIEQAQVRTKQKINRLTFQEKFIDELSFLENSFEVIYSVDTMYFSKDYKETIDQFLRILKPKGQIAIFYMEMSFDPSENKSKLLPDKTALAIALEKCDLKYDYYDFTQDNYRLSQLKRRAAKSLEMDFKNEGNQFIYDRLIIESLDENTNYDEYKLTCSRFLYHIKL